LLFYGKLALLHIFYRVCRGVSGERLKQAGLFLCPR
jgi:hypothetical protein